MSLREKWKCISVISYGQNQSESQDKDGNLNTDNILIECFI